MANYLFNDKEHIHLLDGQPLIGTSTATKIISKPLTWWASGMAMEVFGWKNGKTTSKADRLNHAREYLLRLQEMSLEDYVNLLDEGYSAHSKTLKSKAEAGTDMHAALEKYVKYVMLNSAGVPKKAKSKTDQVQKFADWSVENVKKFLFSEAHCYSEKLWLGGISDCGVELKDGTMAIIDFKSSKDAYFDQFVQAALYDLQFAENGGFDANGKNIFPPTKFGRYIIIPFGAPEFKVKERFDVDKFRETAEATLKLYKHSLQYEK